MSQTVLQRVFSHLGFLQIAILLLVVLTALIHLQHGLAMSGGGGGGPMGGGPGGFGGGSATAIAGMPGAMGTPGKNGPGASGTPQTAGTPGQGGSGSTGNGAGVPGVQGQGMQGGPGGQGGPSGAASILSSLPVSFSVLFFLNFVGYIVLGAALYLPFLRRIQRVVRWLLIAFTAGTIVAYFLIAGTQPNVLGIVDKVIEGALIILLLIEGFQAIKRKGRGEPHEPLPGDSGQPVLSGTR